MTESDSFSSLKALVDSHLSKTSVQGSLSEDINGVSRRIPIPSFSGQNGTLSDTQLSFLPDSFPGKLPRLPFSQGESPITSVLAEQVSNMYKAKELKRQQEEDMRLAEEMKQLQVEDNDSDYIIDLRIALTSNVDTSHALSPPHNKEVLSNSSSLESLFKPKFLNSDDDDDVILEPIKTPEPLLPCITDMSYILKQKIKRGKCSPFGKVLTARVRPVAAPYLREEIASNIVRFDFKTMSPCDLIKLRLRKPTTYTNIYMDSIESGL
ncbi:uncharacterized protein ACR2FA_012102 [Aphomia sociella]